MITVSSNSKEALKKYFHGTLTELDIPELTKIDTLTNSSNYLNALYINSPSLESIKLENLEQSPYILGGNNLKSVTLNKIRQIEQKQISSLGSSNIITPYTQILQYNFLCNTKLTELNLPNFEGVAGSVSNTDYGASGNNTITPSFSNNYWLTDVSLGNLNMLQANTHLNGYWFTNCYFLKYLRLQYPFFIPISSNQGLKTTAIDNIGKIYVPKTLLSKYKGENGFNNGQWADFTSKFYELDQYVIDKANDQEIKDSWEEIIAHCNNGDASNYYSIGQYKTIYVNGTPTQMVIVNINSPLIADLSKDRLSNDSAYAQITWLERTVSRFDQKHITSSIKNYPDATSYQNIMTEIWNNLDGPEAVLLKAANGIKEVIKTSEGIDNGAINNFTYTSKIWTPSLAEIGLRNPNHTYKYFAMEGYDNIILPNYRLGDTNIYTNVSIALRDFQDTNSLSPATLVSGQNGSSVSVSPSIDPYIIFGFCT